MKTSEEKRIMRLCCILLLTILFLCASGPAALSEKGISSSRADQILGVWSGSYPGSETDGEGNALTRETTIRIRSLDADTGAFYGILEYVVPGFRDGLFGSYYIRGSVNTSDWSYTLQGYQMIVDDGYYDHGS